MRGLRIILMEHLVDLVALNQLADPDKVVESEVTSTFAVEQFEQVVDVLLRQIAAQALGAFPKSVLVDSPLL